MALAEQKIKAVEKIDLKSIFEKVNLAIPLEERRFFNYFDDTIREMMSIYDQFVIEKGKEYSPPESLSDQCFVQPLYSSAIVDNILFIIGQNEMYKSEFLRKSKEAYLAYWSENAKGRFMKPKRWWG